MMVIIKKVSELLIFPLRISAKNLIRINKRQIPEYISKNLALNFSILYFYRFVY
jgi:hypothetical protein